MLDRLILRAAATPLAVLALLLCALASCSNPGPATGAWSGPEGLRLEWTPAQPRFGDLVRLTARWPGPAPVPVEAKLLDPAGHAVPPLGGGSAESIAAMAWSVRATVTGEWSWSNSAAAHALWTIASEAGESGELKAFDAAGLWEGRVAPAPAAAGVKP